MSTVINYNEDWVRSVTKNEFLENQKHHSNDTDLSADYDRINPPKESAEKETKKTKE